MLLCAWDSGCIVVIVTEASLQQWRMMACSDISVSQTSPLRLIFGFTFLSQLTLSPFSLQAGRRSERLSRHLVLLKMATERLIQIT